MPQNIKLLVAYDATDQMGWQKTKMGPSIEAALQTVLEKVLQHPVELQAASRTDAGVHAAGQVVNFMTDKDIDCGKLHVAVNGLLGKHIAVMAVSKEREDFHPTLDNIEKEYRYSLCYSRVQKPQQRLYAWHYPRPLNIPRMREAAGLIVGTHDFASFCSMKKVSHYENTIRTVTGIEIQELPDSNLLIIVRGYSFIYKMVRTIAGTLAYVGSGKLAAHAIPHILEGRNRTQAGMTAPAHGLTLYKVDY